MKKLDIEIKNSVDNNNDFYVMLNGEKVNLGKTYQGKIGVLDIEEGDNILEIRKKYFLDNPFGMVGVIFLWIKHIFSDAIGQDIIDDGEHFYKFKMKFNLKSDSKARFYIVDKKNVLINPVNYDIFSSTQYEVLENESINNIKIPINYSFYKVLKSTLCIAIMCTFILLFIW